MTPANQVPVRVQPSGALAALMPLLAGTIQGFIGPQGSGRRLLIGLAGAAVIALNHKLALNLDFQEQSLLAGIVLGIVTMSNTKEALVARAQMAGQAAVQVAMHQANAQIMTAQAQAPVDEEPEAVAPPPPAVAPAPSPAAAAPAAPAQS